MDKQNSRGHKDHTCSTKATLHYASTLKADIQNQVFLLTATLKRIEHDLCMQIDRQCRTKLQGLEYFCEEDKCGAGCQNVKAEFNGDADNGFPKKSKLDRDFKMCMRLCQNYGQTKKFDFSKILSWGSQANKADPVKDQVDTKENVNCAHTNEDSEELYEFVDSVECLLEEGQSVLRTLLENDSKNLPEKLDDSEEAVERASCCSVDSFDVIPNECCMNDSVCELAQTPLPGIVRLRKLPETDSTKENPGHPTFYLPNLQRKEPTNLFSRMLKRSPSQKSPAQKPSLETTGDDKILPWTPNITAGVTEQKTANPAVDASPEEQSAVLQDENNPANALQDSFKAYLQKKDLGTWVHPNSEPKANNYDNWVFKAAVLSSPKPLKELIEGSVSRESGCASDDINGAFYRQLQAFVA